MVAIIILSIVVAVLSVALIVTITMLRKNNTGSQGNGNKKEYEKLREEVRIMNNDTSQNINNSTSNLFNNFSTSFMENFKHSSDFQNERLQKFNDLQTERLQQYNLNQNEKLKQFNNSQIEKLIQLKNAQNEKLEVLEKNLIESQTAEERRFNLLKEEVNKNLENQRKENTECIKQMRGDMDKQLKEVKSVVDEKLSDTINERFNQSFKLVTDRLDAINKGFGQIQELTNGVTDLKKVLFNVKTRGVWGENSLDSLLQQILTNEQYGKQVNIKGNNLVDFAIILPGKNNNNIYLPIDAKFPIEDYQRIVAYSEKGDNQNLKIAKKELVKRIKTEAKSIQAKYIVPPQTTDFAIMYLPIEGLFAEVLKEPGLAEQIQRENHIVIAGPTTIAALLNSLQMGFKTLAIQKSSSEIWKMFVQFRKDFAKFTELLDKTQKKIVEVTNTIGDASKRSEIIQKRLSKVETLAIPDSVIDEIE